MASKTKIEWADASFNAWVGCTKVSPGCESCYAEDLMDRRLHDVEWGKGKPRRRTSKNNWAQPLRWNRKAGADLLAASHILEDDKAGSHNHEWALAVRRPRVFANSLSDWLDPEVPLEWLADFLNLIRQTPHLDWLLLTKRPQLFSERLQGVLDLIGNRGTLDGAFLRAFVENMLRGWAGVTYSAPEVGRENYWIGTSVEDQTRANQRIPNLLKIPAKTRFLSCEPLIEPISLERWMHRTLGWREQDNVYACPGCGAIGHGGYFSIPTGGDDYISACSECGADAEEIEGHLVGNIHWVIVGGESGGNARPLNPSWARTLRDQCQAAGVPFFFKQWGEWINVTRKGAADGQLVDHNGNVYDAREVPEDWHQGETVNGWRQVLAPHYGLFRRVGKKAAGRNLDGREWSEGPELYCVEEEVQ